MLYHAGNVFLAFTAFYKRYSFRTRLSEPYLITVYTAKITEYYLYKGVEVCFYAEKSICGSDGKV